MLDIDPANYRADNILPLAEIAALAAELKQKGEKIGLCLGSFDLLHPGHMVHLVSAKRMCTVLVVGVARDAYSMTKNPASGRPVYSEAIRAYLVSQVKPVDYVFLDPVSSAPDSIALINPDLCIRGPDFRSKHDFQQAIQGRGIEFRCTDDEKFSTTELIEYIKKL